MSQAPRVTSVARLQLPAPSEKTDAAEAFLQAFDLANVTTSPGCYIMHDEKDRVIYVGKAKNLRARLRSYVNESDERYTVRFLMRRVAHIDFLVTTNEKEAVLLENSLIKKHKPRYNVRLKDDKTYVSVRVNVQDDFPRVTITRKFRKDGARYFGPYASAHSVRETVKQIHRLFPLRTCSDAVMRNRTRPCLYYQMKQCVAPCMDYVSREEYRRIVQHVLLALEGRSAEVERQLTVEIGQLAAALEFEKAAEVRDRLYALRRTLERQRTDTVGGGEDRDVFGIYTEGRFSEIQILFYRNGRMTGGRSFSFNQRETPLEEVLSSFLLQYYSEAPNLPLEILVPIPLEEADVLAEILSEQRGGRVYIHAPQRGDKLALVRMAEQNARTSFEEKQLKDKAIEDILELTRDALKLTKVPRRIECFDISTIQGEKSVGSMAVFENGVPAKGRYRRFAIRHAAGQDDFAMMREILMRRFKRGIEEDDLPDLVLIDGGKGQLNVALAAFRDLGIEDMNVVSIAKSRALESGDHSPERFFLPERMNPVILPQNSPVVLLLAQVRDEAHRFAVTYHRKRRAKSTLTTRLEGIPGIGPRRARTLLSRLGSIAKIKEAQVAEIAALPGFSTALADLVKRHVGTPAGGNGSGGTT